MEERDRKEKRKKKERAKASKGGAQSTTLGSKKPSESCLLPQETIKIPRANEKERETKVVFVGVKTGTMPQRKTGKEGKKDRTKKEETIRIKYSQRLKKGVT